MGIQESNLEGADRDKNLRREREASMTGKEQELRKILGQWNEIILAPWDDELAQRLSELDHSALHSCIPDCFESFYRIYHEILPAIAQTPADNADNYDTLHDHFYDLGGIAGALEHIKSHIIDARTGFDVLLRLLAEKAEVKGETEQKQEK